MIRSQRVGNFPYPKAFCRA